MEVSLFITVVDRSIKQTKPKQKTKFDVSELIFGNNVVILRRN